MKRYCLTLLGVALLSVSCKNTIPTSELLVEPEPKSTFVTPQDALSEVEKIIATIDTDTRGGNKRRIANIYSSGGFGETRVEGEDDSPFVYIVNFENNEGFAIASGDTRVPPILAIVDSGNLSPDDIIDNHGIIIMLERIDTSYRLAVGLPIEGYTFSQTPESNETTRNSYSSIGSWVDYQTRGEIIPCEWQQSGDPYNLYTYTPDGQKAPAGCVPIAVAQIMYKWGINHTVDGYYFDWDLMHRHKSTGNPYTPAYSMIGELCYKLGLPSNLNATYTSDCTTASDNNIARTFENFGYISGGSIVDYDFDQIYNVIVSRPVYMSGKATKTTVVKKFLGITISTTTTYSDGHGWVVDKILTRYRDTQYYESGVLVNTERTYQHLLHCNFGWGTNKLYNGYYSDGYFYPKNGIVAKSNTTVEGKEDYFQYLLKMNTTIYPYN